MIERVKMVRMTERVNWVRSKNDREGKRRIGEGNNGV